MIYYIFGTKIFEDNLSNSNITYDEKTCKEYAMKGTAMAFKSIKDFINAFNEHKIHDSGKVFEFEDTDFEQDIFDLKIKYEKLIKEKIKELENEDGFIDLEEGNNGTYFSIDWNNSTRAYITSISVVDDEILVGSKSSDYDEEFEEQPIDDIYQYYSVWCALLNLENK